ncbi:hypothetical protein [Sphingomonas sp.]|uniref:hypothetical protein n=1 Tax=Sphingomonas sp. TaxID=28214 RepID=UPI003F7E1541
MIVMPVAAANKSVATNGSAATAKRDADDLADFDRRARMSRDLGATEMVVTDGLPIARWEEDPDDPYPAWFAHHATLFKMFPPEAVRPFMDAAYAARVQRVVAGRCRILAKYDLKAIWSANEPGVLPEAFFVAHPDYRGPRIDQVTRSRKAYFAPNVSNPDVLAMYREATTALLSACPQVETFLWVTTDAGSGFDWAPGLYPGANGASENRDRPLADRVVRFMTNIQQAAAEAGHRIRININQIPPRPWMIPTFGPDVLENIQRQLPAGLAVNGREGPDGRPFETGVTRVDDGAFSPVVGLVVPSFDPVAKASDAHRAFLLGDRESEDFAFRLLLSTRDQPMATALGRLAALRRFAVSEVGEARADTLVDAWSALNDVRKYLDVLDFGPMLRMGHVLNRWIERPMVPYPAELTDAEKAGYRRFLFQARTEEAASDLADIQAMRMYEGWGAHLLFQRAVEISLPRVRRAQQDYESLAAAATNPEAANYWQLTAKRVQALSYLLQSADDMVGYQAQLDRVTAMAAKPEGNPVLGAQNDWARADMINTARREIDTAVALDKLMSSSSAPLLDLADDPADETIMKLGPDFQAVLRQKVRTMNAHWRDYDRLFTMPNP